MKSLAALAIIVSTINGSPIPGGKSLSTLSNGVIINDSPAARIGARCDFGTASNAYLVTNSTTGVYSCQCLHDYIVKGLTTFGDCMGPVSITSTPWVDSGRMCGLSSSGGIVYKDSPAAATCQYLINAQTSKYPPMPPPSTSTTSTRTKCPCSISFTSTSSTESTTYTDNCSLENAFCIYYANSPDTIAYIKWVAETTYKMSTTCSDACCNGINIPRGC